MEPLLAHTELVMPTDHLLTTLCCLLRNLQAPELVQLASGRCRVLPGIFLVDFVQYPIDFCTCLIIRRVILFVVGTVFPPLEQALLLLLLACHGIFAAPSQVGIHPVIGAQHLLRGIHVVDFDLRVPQGALVNATPVRLGLALGRLLMMRGRKS
jgi:hypothetical protein